MVKLCEYQPARKGFNGMPIRGCWYLNTTSGQRWRSSSKYMPHCGLKEQAKIARRNAKKEVL